jgi:phosphatidylglycerol:prolipoprotein diacylglycerol transferase
MIAFSIGSIDVYWYGIFYMIGFLLWYIFLNFIWRSNFFVKYKGLQDLLKNHTDDVMIAIILGVLFWWRLWEVFIYQWQYFSQNLSQIFAVWNWWMSFIGWIIWVLIALLVLKKIKKLSFAEFWLLIDCIVVIAPLAIIFWRYWNYLNQELYWLIVPENYFWLKEGLVNVLSNLNIFHVYDKIDSNLRINTNFLSMFFEWLVVFLILAGVMFRRFKTKIIKPWFLVWLFLVFYSLFRFFIEYLRIDSQSQYVWMFTRSQWIFILFMVVGFVFLFRKKK